MDFEKFLQVEAEKIKEVEAKLLKLWFDWLSKKVPSLKPHAKAFIKACDGGKKIRGALINLGYQLAGGKSEGILDVAAAYEIFHTSILSHDDVIDQSPIRRGRPSLYRALGGGHHGISQTISLGDMGFFLASKIISQSDFEDKKKVLALEYFAKTTIDTALGELLDVELPYLDKKRQESDVLVIMKYKTARYSVSSPLQLGAILACPSGRRAGADGRMLGLLGRFGESLGIAFQIKDDILGVFGEEEELGKSNKSDIEEGKNTLLIVRALNYATPKQKKLLHKFYGQGTLSKRGLEQVRKIFEETKALTYAQKQAVKYVTLAKKSIPGLTKDTKMSTLLEQMSEYLVERNK